MQVRILYSGLCSNLDIYDNIKSQSMKAMQQKTTKFESYGLFIQFVQNLKLLYITFDIICKNVRSSQMFFI